MTTWNSCHPNNMPKPDNELGGLMVYVLAVTEQRPSKVRLLGWYAHPTEPRWYNEEDNQLHCEVLLWAELPKSPFIERKAALDELAVLSKEMGLYDEGRGEKL